MSANNTTYTVTLDDAVYGEPIKNRTKAIKTADELVHGRTGYKAVVTTSAGKVVHQVSRRKITVHTKPNSKTIPVSKKVQRMVPKGLVAAYERPENGTVVFRNERDDVTKDTRYLVLHVATATLAGWVPTTRAAGKIQNQFAKSAIVTAAADVQDEQELVEV